MTRRPLGGWCPKCGPAGPFDAGSILGAKKRTVVYLAMIRLSGNDRIGFVGGDHNR